MPSDLADRWVQRCNGQRREAFVPGECHPCVVRSAKETVTRRQDRGEEIRVTPPQLAQNHSYQWRRSDPLNLQPKDVEEV
jgi:hypothetical protein